MNDTISAAVAESVRWLDSTQGTGPLATTIRILKVTEEAGEASAAWIGMTGLNPRKGVTHTAEDVAGELADVVITALVAIASLGLDPQDEVTECARKVLNRVGTTVPATRSDTARST